MDFADIIKSIVDQNNRLAIHYGEVTAITNSSGKYLLTVKPSGSSTAISNVRYLRSYVPRVGDIVMIQISKNDMVVIDALASADKSLNPVAYRTTDVSILNGVETDVDFQAVDNDDWDMWDVTDPELLTCKVPGRYMAYGQILIEDASNIDLEVKIYKGAQEIGRQDIRITNASHDWHHQVNTLPFTMAINDTIKMTVKHNHNPDLDLLIDTGGVDHEGYFNALSLIYLGP
jgi:hypothetical protein